MQNLYYSDGFNQTTPIVYEEIDRRLAAEDFMVAVANENMATKKLMCTRYGRCVRMTDALRKPDKDRTSAQRRLLIGSRRRITGRLSLG
jgi:hypothetical protein